MDREQAIGIIKSHEHDLRARGVLRLALFGSLERGEARPDSDVDVMVVIDDGRKFSLIDLAGVRLYLCDLLGRDVDIVERDYLKPFLRDGILAEAVEVF
jgi:predicted nucleotidyltransferase